MRYNPALDGIRAMADYQLGNGIVGGVKLAV